MLDIAVVVTEVVLKGVSQNFPVKALELQIHAKDLPGESRDEKTM